MDVVALTLTVVLLAEIPLALRSAWRVRRRYVTARRYNLRQSRVFAFLTWLSVGVAGIGGLVIGGLVLYALLRAYGPPGVPDADRGVIATLIGSALIALLAFPIAVDRLLTRIANDPTHDDAQEDQGGNPEAM